MAQAQSTLQASLAWLMSLTWHLSSAHLCSSLYLLQRLQLVHVLLASQFVMLVTLQCSGLLSMCRRLIPVSDSYKGDSFFTIENGKKVATPLLLVLAVVELSDVVFAVDSIPAVGAARPALMLEIVLHVLLQCMPCVKLIYLHLVFKQLIVIVNVSLTCCKQYNSADVLL